MSFLNDLSFGIRRKLPMILQVEAAECGLACLAMIASYYGKQGNLPLLRRCFSVSLKGIGLPRVIEIAQQLDLGTRALKLDLHQLGQVRTPCILHWDFNHFVVLKELNGKIATIHDPAHGVRKLPLDVVSRSFTGVALELWPTSGFRRSSTKPALKVRDLLGPISGLKGTLIQILTLALALEVFNLVQPFFIQWVIDESIVSADHELLAALAFGFSLLLVMQQVTSAIRAWALMYFGTTVNIQWRANAFTHLLSLPMSYFERRHVGDVIARFGAIDTIQQTLTTAFLTAVIDGIMSAATFAMMLAYSPSLAGIALATIVLYTLTRVFWHRPLQRANEEQIVRVAKQQSHLLETVRGVKTIKLFNRQDDRRMSWISLLIGQFNADIRVQKLQLLFRELNNLLFGVGGVIIIWLGARMVMNDQFTVGALIAFNAYKLQFDIRAGRLIDNFFEAQTLRPHSERLADIVFSEPEHPAGAGQTRNQLEQLVPSIEFDNITFRYAEGDPTVLDGVSLSIDAGESVALVGPSGCGKTTLLNILSGMTKPTEGSVRIGGLEVERLGTDQLRSVIGTVLQDDVLFAGSISDNISFFDPHADQKWIIECATLSAIHEDIIAMPMGYSTLVGDMGTVLSGGQKQRVLLARALYKRPKILLLDEATSHLDLRREQQVNTAISTLPITRVIVAHRPETIASAGRVVMLVGGRIVVAPDTAYEVIDSADGKTSLPRGATGQ